jgi:hypothetical protein
MPQWAVNQGKTLIAIQVFHLLFRLRRGCRLVEAWHSDHLKVAWGALSPRRASLPDRLLRKSNHAHRNFPPFALR